MGEYIGVIVAIVSLLSFLGTALGIFFYVKFSGAQNTADIKHLKNNIIPDLKKELAFDIKERVHKNDCQNKETIFTMQIKQIEEKIEEHGKMIGDQSVEIKKMSEIVSEIPAALEKILDKIAK